MLDLEKSGPNAGLLIAASVAGVWEHPSGKRGAQKGRTNLWAAGGCWVWAHALC